MENNELMLMIMCVIALITSAISILITLATIDEVKSQIRRLNLVKLRIDAMKNEVSSLKKEINNSLHTVGNLYVDTSDQIDDLKEDVKKLDHKIKDLFWIIEAMEIRPRYRHMKGKWKHANIDE